jgi:hypothetical protein
VNTFSVKLFLKRLHLLPAALWLVRKARYFGSRAVRQEERRRALAFKEFASAHRTMLEQPLLERTAPHKIALFACVGALNVVKLELGLLKGLELAGFLPVVLLDRDPWLARYFQLAGVKRLLYWDQFLTHVRRAAVVEAMSRWKTFHDLLTFEWEGSRVGRFTASTVLRTLRVGALDVQSPPIKAVLLNHLMTGVSYAGAARGILRCVRPQLAVFVDRGYTPHGQLFDACLAEGVDTFTWNATHRSNAVMLKRYIPANRDDHPASVSEDTWRWLCGMAWTEAHRRRLTAEIRDTYARGDWFPEAGTQVNRVIRSPEEIRRRLKLDPGKKTAVIFPHISWDSAFFYGTDLFDNFEDWLVETVAAACRNPHLNWVVKIHPANVVQNHRFGYQEDPSEVTAIRRRIGRLPSHIVMVDADSDLNTFSLFALMDYCLTVRGTIGIEAASAGIPVLTAGTGRYDRKGFTLDADSREEYLGRLAHLHEIPRLTAPQQELAERFAYGAFVLRPFQLTTVTFEFERDLKASAHTRITASAETGWRDAQDLRRFARWVNDRQALDYLDPEQVALATLWSSPAGVSEAVVS